MALHKKTLLVISLAIAGLLGTVYAVSSTILLDSIRKAEEQEIRQTVKGVVNVFTQIQTDFSDRFSDWSQWNDTYRFIEDNNPEYIKTNLVPETLANLKVNLLVYINTSRRLVYSTGFNLKTEKKIGIPPTLKEYIERNDILLQHRNINSNVTGILVLPEGPMMVTSQPILTSQGTGPIQGTLIVGRYLDADNIEQLIRINRLSLSLASFHTAKVPLKLQTNRFPLARKDEIAIRRLSEDIISGYTVLPDIYGKPALLLQVDIPRKIYAEGLIGLKYLFASLVVVGLVFGWVALILVERLLLFKQEREELQKLNQLKDDFLSTISHELRTPLTNIKMAIQMLGVSFNRDDALAKREQIHRYIKILQDECAREISLINDLLDLQRLEAGSQPLSVEKIDLETWLFERIEPFQERTSSLQQTLHLDVPPKLPALITDSSSLERILAELLNNACKYTPPGEKIIVSARIKAGKMHLSVSNSGIEIPASELSQIFNKFYRVPGSDQWKQGGTGLGLALVQKLIEHLGGCIWVESTSGQTRFTVELPVERVGQASLY